MLLDEELDPLGHAFTGLRRQLEDVRVMADAVQIRQRLLAPEARCHRQVPFGNHGCAVRFRNIWIRPL
jgi:hypothetical protein